MDVESQRPPQSELVPAGDPPADSGIGPVPAPGDDHVRIPGALQEDAELSEQSRWLVQQHLRRLRELSASINEVERRLKSTSSPTLIPALTDIRAQLSRLIFPGFVTATGRRRLPDLLRYLRAIERRDATSADR